MFSKDDLPLLAILRGVKAKDLQPLLEVFQNTNIRFLEITMNTDSAADLIKEIKSLASGKMKIGAGTVLNMNDLDTALSAGAEFIVSPSVLDSVIGSCVSQNIPVIPGALSPTEIQKAWDLGATMVKVFPSSVFGPSYIKAVKGPYNQIKIMAVGGVGDKNISEFFLNGADAIGFGASIIKPEWLDTDRYDLIEDSLISLINNFKYKSR